MTPRKAPGPRTRTATPSEDRQYVPTRTRGPLRTYRQLDDGTEILVRVDYPKKT